MSRESIVQQGPASTGDPQQSADAPDDEPMGGDPPCWAHLFGEDPGPTAEELEAAAPPDPSSDEECG